MSHAFTIIALSWHSKKQYQVHKERLVIKLRTSMSEGYIYRIGFASPSPCSNDMVCVFSALHSFNINLSFFLDSLQIISMRHWYISYFSIASSSPTTLIIQWISINCNIMNIYDSQNFASIDKISFFSSTLILVKCYKVVVCCLTKIGN